MKRRILAGVLATGLLVGGYESSARALGFPAIPPIIPDICAAVTGCDITFTDSAVLMDAQQYIAMVQNFKNIHNIAGVQGEIQQVIAMVNAANAAPPVYRGNAAAQTTITTVPNTANRIAAIDAQAQAADGVQQQAQVANAYASTVAGNTAQTTALIAQQQAQDQANTDLLAENLMALGGGELPADGL